MLVNIKKIFLISLIYLLSTSLLLGYLNLLEFVANRPQRAQGCICLFGTVQLFVRLLFSRVASLCRFV